MCKQPVLAFYWSRPLIYEGPHIGFQFHEGNSEFNSEECNSDSNSNSNDGNSNSIPIPPGLGKANSNSIPIPELDLELARKSNSGAELTPTLLSTTHHDHRNSGDRYIHQYSPDGVVTGHFGQVPFRPEQTWKFRTKKYRRFCQKDGRFGQKIFNSFTESDIICRRIHRINSLPIKLPGVPAISFLGRQEITYFDHVRMV